MSADAEMNVTKLQMAVPMLAASESQKNTACGPSNR